MSHALVWFRRDLRLQDNRALSKALAAHQQVTALYIHAPLEEAPWEPGAASRWYLHHSLQQLMADLADIGVRLEFASGDSGHELRQALHRHQAGTVYWNRIFEPALRERDERVSQQLHHEGYEVVACHDHSLLPPDEIRTQSGNRYRVFTPFWKSMREVLQQFDYGKGLAELDTQQYQPLAVNPNSRPLNRLQLLDKHPWHHKMGQYWQFGEQAALHLLRRFAEALPDYPEGRDRLPEQATSRLSAALHFGEISPWRVFNQFYGEFRGDAGGQRAVAAEAYIRQLAWRDFAIQLLLEDPQSTHQSMRREYDDERFWWHDEDVLERWRRGQTGIPLVDAGMRELWETGYMHNRARMVVGSFLTKNLGQHWVHGARWFWDTLIDADLANNTMGWQWVAGSGADAAPYFRVFNPQTQRERFDPHQDYIHRWLGQQYRVSPMVDLKQSREAALERYALIRNKPSG